MTDSNSNEEKERAVWDFIPLSEYVIPSPPVKQKVKKQINFFKNLIKNEKENTTEPFIQKLDLEKLPASKLDRIAPAIDWANGSNQFHQRINDWLEEKSSYNHEIITLIGPSFSGYDEILKNWAERQNLECISPPNADQILSSDKSWFNNPNENSPWIFPNLESAFFRHTEGLNLIRDFLDKAYSGTLGKGIIGCNSWTWNFLSYLWHGKFPYTLALQAFDQDRLTDVFYTLSKKESHREYVFRQSDNGKYIIPKNYPDEDSGENSEFLQSLAAYCRGNLGVAYEYWYSSPRLEPDEILSEKDGNGSDPPSKLTVWITPWNQIKKPFLPSDSKIEKAIVLHSLLIHNGLSFEIIKELLPLSPNQIMETLIILEEAEILGEVDGKWTVKPAGYPAVREFVQSNDYLVDQF